MKKRFALRGLDCANCAAKMESAIEKLPGVTSCTGNFLTQTLILEGEDDRFDELAAQAAKICKRVDRSCVMQL